MLRSLFAGSEVKLTSNSRRYPSLVFNLIFLAAILLIALSRDSQIIVVLSLYFCILLESLSICAFVYYSRASGNDQSARESTRTVRSGSSVGMDLVSSMKVYVTYAEKGSSHSRREIAFIVRNILKDLPSEKREPLEADPDFQADVRKVVWKYTDDYERVRNRGRGVSRQEREAYLSCLERVIRKLSPE